MEQLIAKIKAIIKAKQWGKIGGKLKNASVRKKKSTKPQRKENVTKLKQPRHTNQLIG
jgi:hypothetical protein